MNNGTDTNSTSVQVDSSTTLTKNEMQNIIGMHWRGRIGTWGLARRRVRFAIRHRRAIKAFGRDVAIGGIVGAGTGAIGGFMAGKWFAPLTKGASIPASVGAGALIGFVTGAVGAGKHHVLTRAWPEQK